MSLNLARLATNRSAERTITSGVLTHPTDAQYGQMMYVIDIPLPRAVADVVEHTIIETLNQEYFKTDRRSALYQFEDCLKQVNLGLAELAEDGNTDWVGHIHACIALWADGELYLTHAGRIMAMIGRAATLVSLVESNANERRVHVHKTFANLTSGRLEVGDRLIIGNGEISRHFSPQFLSQAIQSEPYEAAQQMFQTARRLNVRTATAIVGMVGDQADEDSVYQDVPTIYLEANGAERKTVGSSVSANSKRTAQVLATLSKGKDAITSQSLRLLPHVKKLVGRVRHSIRSAAPPQISYDEQDKSVQASTEALTETPITLRSPTLQRSPGLKIDQLLKHSVRLGKYWLQNIARTMRQLPPRLLLFGAIALVIVVAALAWNKSHHSSGPSSVATAQVNDKINQTRTLLDQANAKSQSQPDQARDDLVGVADNLAALQNSSASKDQLSSLQSSYANILKTLNNVNVINQNDLTPVAAGTSNIVVIGQYLFSIQSGSGTVWRQTLSSKDAAAAYTIPNATIIYMNAVNEERSLLVFTASHDLYRIDIASSSPPTKLVPPTGEQWANLQGITVYLDNIYALESGTGQVWKYVTHDKVHYTTRQTYLASQSLVNASATDITTDGSIYILESDGSIMKLLKGAPQSFGPTTIPKPTNAFQHPSRIFTGSSVNSVFVVDDTRVTEIGKDGQYVRQSILSSGHIDQSFVSPQSRRAWLLNGTSVISTAL